MHPTKKVVRSLTQNRPCRHQQRASLIRIQDLSLEACDYPIEALQSTSSRESALRIRYRLPRIVDTNQGRAVPIFSMRPTPRQPVSHANYFFTDETE